MQATAAQSGSDGFHTAPGSYLADYDYAFSRSETLYHVPDTWDTQAIVTRFVEARLGSGLNQHQ